jgi:hypothetical protein
MNGLKPVEVNSLHLELHASREAADQRKPPPGSQRGSRPQPKEPRSGSFSQSFSFSFSPDREKENEERERLKNEHLFGRSKSSERATKRMHRFTLVPIGDLNDSIEQRPARA